jgi:phosphoesterase RecJ-like protein
MVLAHDVLYADSTDPDTEGIVNQGKGIDGVAVSVLFKEAGDEQFRVSLRSDDSVDVAALAGRFGGGGHPRAAGCTVEGTLDEARAAILGLVRAEMGLREQGE